MAEDNQAPVIIVKKIQRGGHGHHGGAWKVAYADFVTAMMAFFLLLWLLSATTEVQKEGIAEYFTPTIGLKEGQGIGFKGGMSPSEKGVSKSDTSPEGIVVGRVAPGQTPDAPEVQAQIESDKDAQLFQKAEEEMKRAMEDDPTLRDFKDSVVVEQTPEGLKIQLLDLDKKPMFEPGSASLTPFGQTMLEKLGQIVLKMPNLISITGHTDAKAFSRGASYGNWELSADRANASRRFLITDGKVEPTRVMKVVGMADRDLLDKDNPNSPRNRRISIILLRGSYLELTDSEKPAPRGLLSVPRITGNKPPPAHPAAKPAPAAAPPAAPPKSVVPPKVKTAPTVSPGSMALPSGLINRQD